MKYSRMLCWVRPHEKKELKKALNGKFPLVFAKNYDDFKSQICDNDYLVISFKKVNNKVLNLVRGFKNNIFVFYEIQEEYKMTSLQFDIFDEKNIITGQYGANELVKNYLGEISDLWKMRINQSFCLA